MRLALEKVDACHFECSSIHVLKRPVMYYLDLKTQKLGWVYSLGGVRVEPGSRMPSCPHFTRRRKSGAFQCDLICSFDWKPIPIRTPRGDAIMSPLQSWPTRTLPSSMIKLFLGTCSGWQNRKQE